VQIAWCGGGPAALCPRGRGEGHVQRSTRARPGIWAGLMTTGSRSHPAARSGVLLELVRRFGPVAFIDRRVMQRQAKEVGSALAVDFPRGGSRVRRLSGGQRQAVAICRAAGFGSRPVIMDEQTVRARRPGDREGGRTDPRAARRRTHCATHQPQLPAGQEARCPGVDHALQLLCHGPTHHRDHQRQDRRPHHGGPDRPRSPVP
jgi:hypothetical protein